MKIIVKVKTNKSNPGVEEKEGFVEVSVASAPLDGKANEELIDLLSQHYEVSKSSIEIERGASAREKVVHISTWQKR
jgi:uncharacterized protein